MNLPDALTYLHPTAEWSLTANDYSTLIWHGPGEKPTLEELENAWENRPPPPVVVTMTALRLTLIEMELEDDVLTIINAIPDAKQKAAALAWWQTAQTVRRNHPLVAQLSAALGKTDVEIDAIFAAAITLSATL
jgi:hypothetical protein